MKLRHHAAKLRRHGHVHQGSPPRRIAVAPKGGRSQQGQPRPPRPGRERGQGERAPPVRAGLGARDQLRSLGGVALLPRSGRERGQGRRASMTPIRGLIRPASAPVRPFRARHGRHRACHRHGTGVVVFDIGNGADPPGAECGVNGARLDGAGRIVTAGCRANGSNVDMAVYRLKGLFASLHRPL